MCVRISYSNKKSLIGFGLKNFLTCLEKKERKKEPLIASNLPCKSQNTVAKIKYKKRRSKNFMNGFYSMFSK
jgi:hypothetical protein